MNNKIKVLFICIHNSARSQMAEEFLKKFGQDAFEVESAGFEPTEINPLVVQVMKEEGIDLSSKKTQSVFELVKTQKIFQYVISVCSREKEQDCPMFPGLVRRIYWEFDNPENFTGTEKEKMEKISELRDKIIFMVQRFIDEVKK